MSKIGTFLSLYFDSTNSIVLPSNTVYFERYADSSRYKVTIIATINFNWRFGWTNHCRKIKRSNGNVLMLRFPSRFTRRFDLSLKFRNAERVRDKRIFPPRTARWLEKFTSNRDTLSRCTPLANCSKLSQFLRYCTRRSAMSGNQSYQSLPVYSGIEAYVFTFSVRIFGLKILHYRGSLNTFRIKHKIVFEKRARYSIRKRTKQ